MSASDNQAGEVVRAHLQELLDALQRSQVVIFEAQTGSGKSTQIPPFLQQNGYAERGVIACTQPRRIAASSLSRWVASDQGSGLGDVVGYTVRFDNQTTTGTQVKYLTDGMLLHEVPPPPVLLVLVRFQPTATASATPLPPSPCPPNASNALPLHPLLRTPARTRPSARCPAEGPRTGPAATAPAAAARARASPAGPGIWAGGGIWWTVGGGGGGMVDRRDSAWRSRAPGTHAHGNTARQAMDGLRTEARGRQKQSNDPGNNQHILNTPIIGRH